MNIEIYWSELKCADISCTLADNVKVLVVSKTCVQRNVLVRPVTFHKIIRMFICHTVQLNVYNVFITLAHPDYMSKNSVSHSILDRTSQHYHISS